MQYEPSTILAVFRHRAGWALVHQAAFPGGSFMLFCHVIMFKYIW